MNNSEKSRDIPLSDFYTILQYEYISYYIRHKIYPQPYCEKYRKYCGFKKEKIEKISIKNSLPSIFTNKQIKEKYIKGFLNHKGLPNFEYRDDQSRSIMGFYDKVYWFSKGVSVRADFAGESSVVVILENVPKQDKVIVKMGILNVDLSYNEITRIISDSLIDF